MNELIMYDKEQKQFDNAIIEFNTKLNSEPNPKEIVTNKNANNSKYLPISFVEMELDEVFGGIWKTHSFKYQVVANEIIGDIVLEIWHPILNTWISRTGSAASIIRTKQRSDFTDVRNKLPNALVMDMPRLEADCIKSAAKKFGKRFGRDLNRELEDMYNPVYEEVADEKKNGVNSAVMDWLIHIQENITNENGVKEMYGKIREFVDTDTFTKHERRKIYDELVRISTSKKLANFDKTTGKFIWSANGN